MLLRHLSWRCTDLVASSGGCTIRTGTPRDGAKAFERVEQQIARPPFDNGEYRIVLEPMPEELDCQSAYRSPLVYSAKTRCEPQYNRITVYD